MPHTTFAPTTGLLWNTLVAEGVDPEPLFRQMGVIPDLMKDPTARVREKTVVDLWKRAVDLLEDPCLGIKAATHWHPSQLGALGYAWLASSTLRTALNRVVRYMGVINESQEITLAETAAGVVYSILPSKYSAVLPADGDLHLAVLTEMCRVNYGAKLNPVAVSFTHAAPACAGEYFAFFRCPVEFDNPVTSLTLATKAVDWPLPGNNPLLAKLNDQVMVDYLAQLGRKRIVERTRALIIDQLPSGDINKQAVAEGLAISTRTLQRRLQKEGTTFNHLLEETRRDLADQYLRGSDVSLGEISFLLGFSETSAFSRAFKRWTGYSPGEYREKNSGK